MVGNLERLQPYKVVSVGETTSDPCVLSCEKHGDFSTLYFNAIKRQTGCPSCATKGFSDRKVGKFYINSVEDFSGNLIALKYGITNQEIENRVDQLNKNCQDVIVKNIAYWEDDGGNIRQLEKLIKVTLGGRYLSQDILPQGYTETLPPWYLERLLDFVKKLNNKNKD